jgi:hypothetical protein
MWKTECSAIWGTHCMISPSLYSNRAAEWPIPQSNLQFHYTLDPCAAAENASCAILFTIK